MTTSYACAPLTCAARTTAMLALIASAVQASAQDSVSERRMVSLVAPSLRGEIDYMFDTALNRTSAQYKTSLGSTNFIKRLFTDSPDVHTLIATYQFGGRVNAALPDVVQLAFISDEYFISDDYEDGLANDPRASWRSPLLIVRTGETVMRFPLGIAQRTEVWSASGSERQTAVHLYGATSLINMNYGPTSLINMNAARIQVHIERTATAWIRLCDFLSIVNGRDVRGTVAGLDFDVSDEVLAGMRQFTAEMSLGVTEFSKASCPRE